MEKSLWGMFMRRCMLTFHQKKKESELSPAPSSVCPDHSALHAQVPATRPRHPQGVWRGAVPRASRPSGGGHALLLLPGDRVHHRHCLSEPTGSAADQRHRHNTDTDTTPTQHHDKPTGGRGGCCCCSFSSSSTANQIFFSFSFF